MNITKLDSATVDRIIEDLAEAIQAVADKHGLAVERKRCTYHRTDMPVPFRLHVVEVGADGEAIDKAKRKFDEVCHLYGLRPDHYGAEFGMMRAMRNGRLSMARYRVTGINTRRHKFPVSACNVDTGKGYKFTLAKVRRALGLDIGEAIDVIGGGR